MVLRFAPTGILNWIIGAAVILLIAVVGIFLKTKSGPSIPDALRPGKSLPNQPCSAPSGFNVQRLAALSVLTQIQSYKQSDLNDGYQIRSGPLVLASLTPRPL